MGGDLRAERLLSDDLDRCGRVDSEGGGEGTEDLGEGVGCSEGLLRLGGLEEGGGTIRQLDEAEGVDADVGVRCRSKDGRVDFVGLFGDGRLGLRSGDLAVELEGCFNEVDERKDGGEVVESIEDDSEAGGALSRGRGAARGQSRGVIGATEAFLLDSVREGVEHQGQRRRGKGGDPGEYRQY